jgi:pimeloyl-ACP methyl ester carboxylesterase
MGHRVSTPTQTGLGERKHLLSKDITLDTFAADIVNHVEAEELNDVILVGHSFGGTSITGAADKMPNRIRHLVYLDSVIMAKAYSVYCLPMWWQLGAKPSLSRDKGSSFHRHLRPLSVFPRTTPRQIG